MISHNMTWIQYPSHISTSFEDIISSQNIISRFMHGYFAIFVPPGLLAGIVILVTFIKAYTQHTMEKPDILISSFAVTNIIMILFSFTVMVRPDYLQVSYFQCGTLSFFFNFIYFGSQYLLMLMMLRFYFNRYPPQNALIIKAHRKPLVCIAFVLMWAFCIALIAVALLGIENYHGRTACQLDPLFAWPEYEIIKFAFGFGVPSLFQLFCFILLLVKGTQPEIHSPGQNIRSDSTVLVTAITVFTCRLFYNILLLSRTDLKIKRNIGTPKSELLMNIAEIVLFAESCISLLIILCLHKPYRSSFLNFIRNITKVCRRGRTNHRSLEMPETRAEVLPGPSENESH